MITRFAVAFWFGYEKLPVGAEFSDLANTVRVRESDDDVDWAAPYGINN